MKTQELLNRLRTVAGIIETSRYTYEPWEPMLALIKDVEAEGVDDSDLLAAKAELAFVVTQVDKLNEELKASRDAHATLLNRFDNLARILKEEQAKTDPLRNDLRFQMGRVEKARTEIESLKDQLGETHDQIATLRESLANSPDEIKSLSKPHFDFTPSVHGGEPFTLQRCDLVDFLGLPRHASVKLTIEIPPEKED